MRHSHKAACRFLFLALFVLLWFWGPFRQFLYVQNWTQVLFNKFFIFFSGLLGILKLLHIWQHFVCSGERRSMRTLYDVYTTNRVHLIGTQSWTYISQARAIVWDESGWATEGWFAFLHGMRNRNQYILVPTFSENTREQHENNCFCPDYFYYNLGSQSTKENLTKRNLENNAK